MKKSYVILAAAVFIGLSFTLWFKQPSKNLNSDEALLSLVKNDLKAFKNYMSKGGSIHDPLPLIDGQKLTIAEGIVYFERSDFLKFVHSKKMKISTPDSRIVSIAVEKSNSEIFEMILNEDPAALQLNDKKSSLIHMASENCSDKIVKLLHKKTNVSWHTEDVNGRTPLTIASEKECLSIIKYWKENKAHFASKDGRGVSAMDVLKKKKGPEINKLIDSLEKSVPANSQKVAAAPKVVNFYKKRVIPKDQIINRSSLIEPEARPMEDVETAEHSEFAD